MGKRRKKILLFPKCFSREAPFPNRKGMLLTLRLFVFTTASSLFPSFVPRQNGGRVTLCKPSNSRNRRFFKRQHTNSWRSEAQESLPISNSLATLRSLLFANSICAEKLAHYSRQSSAKNRHKAPHSLVKLFD